MARCTSYAGCFYFVQDNYLVQKSQYWVRSSFKMKLNKIKVSNLQEVCIVISYFTEKKVKTFVHLYFSQCFSVNFNTLLKTLYPINFTLSSWLMSMHTMHLIKSWVILYNKCMYKLTLLSSCLNFIWSIWTKKYVFILHCTLFTKTLTVLIKMPTF